MLNEACDEEFQELIHQYGLSAVFDSFLKMLAKHDDFPDVWAHVNAAKNVYARRYDDENFIDRLYDCEEDTAIDFLFDHVDDLLQRGLIDRCDHLLLSLDLDRLSLTVIIAALSITLSARSKLKNRQRFIEYVESMLIDQDLKDRLLIGLR